MKIKHLILILPVTACLFFIAGCGRLSANIAFKNEKPLNKPAESATGGGPGGSSNDIFAVQIASAPTDNTAESSTPDIVDPQKAYPTSTINIIGAKLLKENFLADLTAQPWKKLSLKADNFVWSKYQPDNETLTNADSMTHSSQGRDDVGGLMTNLFNWWYHAGNEDNVPASSFMLKLDKGAYHKDNTVYTKSNYINPSIYGLWYKKAITRTSAPLQQPLPSNWVARFKIAGVSDPNKPRYDEVKEITNYFDNSGWGFKRVTNAKDDEKPFSYYINAKKYGPYFFAEGLTVGQHGKFAFRYQDIGENECNDNKCSREYNSYLPNICDCGSWYIKTNSTTYGPYDNVSAPILTSYGDVYYFIPNTSENNLKYLVYKSGKLIKSWDYADNFLYNKDASEIVYRAREGENWFVVYGSWISEPYNYIDKLLWDDDQNAAFYRARDKQGNWFVAKNNEFKLPVPFELDGYFVNDANGKIYAFERINEVIDGIAFEYRMSKIYSVDGLWNYNEPVWLSVVNKDGKMLFKHSDYQGVKLALSGGVNKEVCDSAICGIESKLWINDKEIGEIGYRPTPKYSADKKFVEKYVYNGIINDSTGFDTDGNLVLYQMKNDNLYKLFYATP